MDSFEAVPEAIRRSSPTLRDHWLPEALRPGSWRVPQEGGPAAGWAESPLSRIIVRLGVLGGETRAAPS